ncbi:FAD-dependent oxidoreductase, partial [Galactobacillus timonensis]|uniref:NAD(P)/FAD-dependent oxidoreductase n=1 Tax=Galactobacillus timonensis TaxID=2041840 RepID=UPI00240A7077
LYEQATSLGAEFIPGEVLKITPGTDDVTVQTASGTYVGKALIYAAGAAHRRLGLPNEEKLIGRGISFCANCDGAFFKGKVVAVNGGGNTALDDALYLSRVAKEVYLIHRRKEYRAEQPLQKAVAETANIHPILDTTITELHEADGHLTSITLHNQLTQQDTELAVDGLFLSVGMKPETTLLSGIVDLNNAGYILAGEDTRTSVNNIFAAGDVRNKTVRQLTTAAADGTAAAIAAVAL